MSKMPTLCDRCEKAPATIKVIHIEVRALNEEHSPRQASVGGVFTCNACGDKMWDQIMRLVGGAFAFGIGRLSFLRSSSGSMASPNSLA